MPIHDVVAAVVLELITTLKLCHDLPQDADAAGTLVGLVGVCDRTIEAGLLVAR